MQTSYWLPRWCFSAFVAAVAATSASAATHVVEFSGIRFSPSDLTIAVGDMVTFTNRGGTHTVSSRSAEPFCGDAPVPVSCTRTFNNVGTFAYACNPHESSGMTGVIRVVSGETSPLTVMIHGRGTVTPDYSGQQLLVGTSYTITAVPAQGFAFTGWTGGLTSSPARLTFTMTANLVLEANFADNVRPTITITSPPANARLTNGTLTLSGTARDNGDVTVWYRVETGAGTNEFQMASGTTNWSVAFDDLAPGAYRFRVHARDSAGNLSADATRSVQILAPLTVTSIGDGTVGGGFAGTTFRDVGRRLSIPALPKPGSLFSNWTGNIVSTTNPLVFILRTNTTLQANFVANPFLPLKGSFEGQVGDEDLVRPDNTGFVTFTLTDRGKYSGRLQLAGKRLPFSGQFSLDGHATNSVKRPGTNELRMELMLDLNGGSETVEGVVSNALGGWIAGLYANRSPVYLGTNASPYQGKYTLIIKSIPAPTTDLGNSFGSVVVSAKGKLTFRGTLADGTPVTQNTTVSKSGFWPLFASLYGGKGFMISSLTIDPTPSAWFGQAVRWTKPTLSTARYYPAGFTNWLPLEASIYKPPGTNKVLQMDTGTIRFDGGGLSGAFTNRVTLGNNNKLSNLTTNQPLALTITLPTGLFNGTATVTNEGVRTKLTFKGAIVQGEQLGAGFFLGTNQSGSVLFDPAP